MDKYPKYISQEQQELFERFLMDKMSIKEKLAFEEQLSAEKDFQQSFEEFKLFFETVEEAGLEAKLEDFHSAVEPKEETPVKTLDTSKIKFNYRIAASIAILMGIGGIWFFNMQNPNEKLFEEYYSPDPGLPTVMGTSDNYKFYEAMVDYKQGNYEIAIEKWEKLLTSKPKNDTLNYFLGCAYLANKSNTEALNYFEETLNSSTSTFYEEASYYAGLTLLKQNKTKEAIENLEMVQDNRSKELLKIIKE